MNLAEGQIANNRDFANFQAGSISGVKFNDLDADGVQDEGEPGLAGWTIFLDRNANGQMDPGERLTLPSEPAPAAREKTCWLFDDLQGELVAVAESSPRFNLKNVKFDPAMWAQADKSQNTGEDDWIVDLRPKKILMPS